MSLSQTRLAGKLPHIGYIQYIIVKLSLLRVCSVWTRLLFVPTRNMTLLVCEQLLLCDFNGHQSQSDLFINQQRLQK